MIEWEVLLQWLLLSQSNYVYMTRVYLLPSVAIFRLTFIYCTLTSQVHLLRQTYTLLLTNWSASVSLVLSSSSLPLFCCCSDCGSLISTERVLVPNPPDRRLYGVNSCVELFSPVLEATSFLCCWHSVKCTRYTHACTYLSLWFVRDGNLAAKTKPSISLNHLPL